MKALSITAYGRVQGVYFRVSTREQALALSIKGWCKNQKDGSVLIHAEGTDEMLKAFVVWCYQGPMMAKVNEVKAEEVPVGCFTDFEIRS